MKVMSVRIRGLEWLNKATRHKPHLSNPDSPIKKCSFKEICFQKQVDKQAFCDTIACRMIASVWNILLRLRVSPSIPFGNMLRLFIFCAALAAPLNQAAAVTLNWGTGGVGGAGTWSTTTSNWYNGSTNIAWPSSGTDNDAVFAGANGGIVTLGSAVTANDLTFKASNYSLSSHFPLTLNGSTPTITIDPGLSVTINSLIAGSAGLYKAGAGTLLLASSGNNWSGGTFIEAGRIALSGGNDRLPTSTSVTLGSAASSGTLQLGSSSTPRNQTLGGLLATGLGGNVVGSANGTTANLTLNIASGINTFGGNGVIGGSTIAENNIALTKTGTGTLELTRANTYTAGTTVSTGTLLANNSTGSATGTGAVTVAVGATVGGSGLIAGATTISGILAPGNSIGTLTVSNDVIWNGSSLLGGEATKNWKFELGAANTADLLQITGATSEFIKGSGSVFCFDFMGSSATGTFTLVDWASAASVGGGVLGTNFNVADFTYTNLGSSNTGSFQFNGSQLEFQAVPEPSTTTLSLISAVLFGTHLAIRRRRRV
jgi:fibronectin-binding autotransporter adhesin